MSKFDLDNYNDEQKNALISTEGAVLVTAGAGSGKTRLLTGRIAYLIEEKGVSPFNILAITFTNKAANEMKERVEKLVPDGGEVWISTFHSMCVRILRKNISLLGAPYSQDFSIYSESDSEKVLKKIFTEKNITDDKLKKSVVFHISNIKSKNLNVMEYRLDCEMVKDIDTIIDVYRLYEQELRKNNALDFDDLLLKTCELFEKHSEVKDYYAGRFKYVLVDEFQDTNSVQFKLTKDLSSYHKNIFVVGDEDQSIYSWRGANSKNIINFTKSFDNVSVFKLERNYRSSKRILEYANKVIKNNSSRLEKKLWTENGEGYPVETYVAYDEQEEAEYVAKTIKTLNQLFGVKMGEIAVLTRLNALSLPFEEKFMNYAIPYRMFGGFKFFERVEIKNIIAYLRLFANPNDEMSFLRIINFPKRGIGDGAISKLRQLASDNYCSLLDMCKKLSSQTGLGSVFDKFAQFGKTILELEELKSTLDLYKFSEIVVKRFNLYSAYNKDIEQERDKILNIDQFLVSLSEQVEKNPDLNLTQYLETITLISDIDSMDEGDDNVKLATIHAVKGLEFKVVFIVGLEESIFPITRSQVSQDDIEEERRLMYVAITRAKERLFLTRANTRYLYGKRDYMLPSRFVSELGLLDAYRKPMVEAKSVVKREETGYNNYAKPQVFVATKPSIHTFTTQTLQKSAKDISIYHSGQVVDHTRFGRGTIVSVDYNDKSGDIKFDDFGVKTLLLEIAPLTIIEE